MPKLRRAGVDDAADLVRLRAMVLAAMGQDVSGQAWRRDCEAAFRRRLTERDFAAWVVEADDALVSTAVGWVEQHLPSPGDRSGRRGRIASVSTDPSYRRQGHAQAVVQALMAWFGERAVVRVELNATPDGRATYERLGFRPAAWPALTWTAGPVSPVSRR